MYGTIGFLLITAISLILSGLVLQIIFAEEIKIPGWIKNNAKWWSNGEIDDKTFASGIQFMITDGIIKIPLTQSGQTNAGVKIPEWIKNNAKWWSNGEIDDKTFASGIQFMIKEGIISVDVGNSGNSISNDLDISKCDKYETPAEKRMCQKEIELANKIKNDMEKSTKYVVGPVNFYYVDNKIEKTPQGGTILTIYFVVENTGNSDNVVMSCPVNACNYALSDGQKEIQYTTNTLVYGSLTLQPHEPELLEWSFFKGLDYDPAKDYSFKIREPWGKGTIPLKID
jgi:hypothetical protein